MLLKFEYILLHDLHNFSRNDNFPDISEQLSYMIISATVNSLSVLILFLYTIYL